jgi:hypothetical protein
LIRIEFYIYANLDNIWLNITPKLLAILWDQQTYIYNKSLPL